MNNPENDGAGSSSSGKGDTSDSICRMYRKLYPDEDELVLVVICEIIDTGVYARLVEYGNIMGMIPLSELSRSSRIRSVQKLVKIGKTEFVSVIKVDREKGYIDLSKRRLTSNDVAECEQNYVKSKTVHSIIRRVSDQTKSSMLNLYQNFGWDLYDKYGHAYDAFRVALLDFEKVFGEFEINDAVKTELRTVITHKLSTSTNKMRANFEVRYFGYDGIDGIRSALSEGISCQTEQIPLSVNLISSPLYTMTTSCADKEEGARIMNEALVRISKKLKQLGIHGNYQAITIITSPHCVSENDDKELEDLVKKIEAEDNNKNGDDDEEDGEDTEGCCDDHDHEGCECDHCANCQCH